MFHKEEEEKSKTIGKILECVPIPDLVKIIWNYYKIVLDFSEYNCESYSTHFLFSNIVVNEKQKILYGCNENENRFGIMHLDKKISSQNNTSELSNSLSRIVGCEIIKNRIFLLDADLQRILVFPLETMHLHQITLPEGTRELQLPIYLWKHNISFACYDEKLFISCRGSEEQPVLVQNYESEIDVSCIYVKTKLQYMSVDEHFLAFGHKNSVFVYDRKEKNALYYQTTFSLSNLNYILCVRLFHGNLYVGGDFGLKQICLDYNGNKPIVENLEIFSPGIVLDIYFSSSKDRVFLCQARKVLVNFSLKKNEKKSLFFEYFAIHSRTYNDCRSC
jgi:hypothetical protein